MVRSRHISSALLRLGVVTSIALGGLLAGMLGSDRAFGAEPRLPNIVADPPNNTSLETSSGSGESKLLLRFNGYIHNVGPGALEFRGLRTSTSEPMKAIQRVYYSDGSFKEEPSSAQLEYVSADGHEHWHLQRAARYSLWNASRNAEAAPAMKVGFCLDDSEHVEPSVGPSEAVYSDANGRKFCRQHEPEALTLWEGVSAGWRDLYKSTLTFQWVDVSRVLPGEYWLREDVDPTHVIKEAGGENAPEYATKATIIPGFDALAQSASTPAGTPVALTLSSKAWPENNSATRKYTIVTPPKHGALSAVSGNKVTYTPEPYYYGPDSFTFSASDPNSQFPKEPAVATVALEVGAGQNPSVALEGVPASMIVGTSTQLSALVTNDKPTVTWSASAGTISSSGLYTAPSEPPAGGSVVVKAVSSRGAEGQATIKVVPVPPPEPRPAAQPTAPGEPETPSAPPPTTETLGLTSTILPAIYRPGVILLGHRLIMTTKVTRAGKVRLTAFIGHRRLGTCATLTPADRSFTCRVTLEKGIRANAKISVLASLRIGTTVLDSLRPAAPVPKMKTTGAGHAHAAGLGLPQFWCSPYLAE